MKVSEITLTKTTRVEGDTDAYYILSNQFQLDQYVARFGNVEVVWDDKWNVYRVPALADKIARYSKAKSIDCAKWGCE